MFLNSSTSGNNEIPPANAKLRNNSVIGGYSTTDRAPTFVGVKPLDSSQPLSVTPLMVDDQITNAGETIHSPLGLQSANLEGGFDSRFSAGLTMNSGSPLKQPVASGFRKPIKEALADQEVSQKRLAIINQHPLYTNRRFGTDGIS